MSPCLRWAVGAAVWYGLILAGQDYAQGLVGSSAGALKLVYGLGFMVLGIVVLGALARWFPKAEAVVWRSAAILTSALLAAAAIALPGAGGWSAQRIDLWMAALLGLGIAVIASRFLPAPWVDRWLGRADVNKMI